MAAETLTIRTAERGDLPGIDAMLSRSYPRLLKREYPPSIMVTAVPLLSRAQPALIASGTYFVAEADGQVVGAGGWTFGSPQQGQRRRGVAHVRHVATDPTRVRRGIGRAIMARVFETALEAGVRRLECVSTRTAVPFYEACGFAVVGPVTVGLRLGVDFPAIRMVRRL